MHKASSSVTGRIGAIVRTFGRAFAGLFGTAHVIDTGVPPSGESITIVAPCVVAFSFDAPCVIAAEVLAPGFVSKVITADCVVEATVVASCVTSHTFTS